MLVADERSPGVHLISPTGATLRPIGTKGAGPGEYDTPRFVLPLAGDSTAVIDQGNRRMLILSPDARITKTSPLPRSVAAGAATMGFADTRGRLYYGQRVSENGADNARTVHRWNRNTDAVETVATFNGAAQIDKARKIEGFKGEVQVSGRVTYAPADDWVVAPSGAIAIIRGNPYRVDWQTAEGKRIQGTTIAYTPIPVTDGDRRAYEPKGPPYARTYAKTKTPFIEQTAVVDPDGNLLIPRSTAFDAATRTWDVVNSQGVPVTTFPLARKRFVVAVTQTHVYVRYTDTDDLVWLERYRR
ncbi:MAG: hypothetical protein ACO1Q7_05170 [Gemmatimonas sp.]